jgi:hypothetical protein
MLPTPKKILGRLVEKIILGHIKLITWFSGQFFQYLMWEGGIFFYYCKVYRNDAGGIFFSNMTKM